VNLFELGYEHIINITHIAIDSFLWSFLFWALSAFVALVLFFLVLKKINKTPVFFNKKTILYYLIILSFFSGINGGLLSIKKYTDKEISTTILPFTKLVFPTYQYYISSYWDKIVKYKIPFHVTVHNFCAHAKFKVDKGENFREKTDIVVSNYFTPYITAVAIESIVVSARDWEHKQENNQNTDTQKALLLAKQMSTYKYPIEFWDEVDKTAKKSVESKFKYFLYLNLAVLVTLLIIPVIVKLFFSVKK
jgi:hypothetical protein